MKSTSNDKESDTEKVMRSELKHFLNLKQPQYIWKDLIIINPDGSSQNLKQIKSKLLHDQLIGSDGGNIEPIFLYTFEDFGYPELVMFCDDNGTTKKLPINPIATKLYQFGRSWFGEVFVRGRIVIFSPQPETKLLDSLLKVASCPKSITQVKQRYLSVKIKPGQEVLMKVLLTLANQEQQD